LIAYRTIRVSRLQGKFATNGKSMVSEYELKTVRAIVSTKCLKNGHTDGIAVSVGSPWSEKKISQTYQKTWLELRKERWFYVTKKSPGIEGKRSLGSNGTPLLVRCVHRRLMS
jgi:hypothetical protein